MDYYSHHTDLHIFSLLYFYNLRMGWYLNEDKGVFHDSNQNEFSQDKVVQECFFLNFK